MPKSELKLLIEQQAREMRNQPKGLSRRKRPDDVEPEEEDEIEEVETEEEE